MYFYSREAYLDIACSDLFKQTFKSIRHSLDNSKCLFIDNFGYSKTPCNHKRFFKFFCEKSIKKSCFSYFLFLNF